MENNDTHVTYENINYTISVDVAKDTEDNNFFNWYNKKTEPSKLWREIWKEKK